MFDTRIYAQGPALNAGDTRTITIRGLCGVPSEAQAVMANLTVVNTGGAGYITAYPSDLQVRPTAATIVFAANEPAEGNGSILPLASSGTSDFAVYSLAHTDVVIDVFGYFR